MNNKLSSLILGIYFLANNIFVQGMESPQSTQQQLFAHATNNIKQDDYSTKINEFAEAIKDNRLSMIQHVKTEILLQKPFLIPEFLYLWWHSKSIKNKVWNNLDFQLKGILNPEDNNTFTQYFNGRKAEEESWWTPYIKGKPHAHALNETLKTKPKPIEEAIGNLVIQTNNILNLL